MNGDLVIAPGGVVDLVGSDVTFDGSITARSGSVTLSNILPNRSAAGDVNIGADSQIDVRGVWTNNLVNPTIFGGKAFVNGGSVTASSVGNLTLGSGASIDASSGGLLDPLGRFTGGAGGNITLLAGVPSPDQTEVGIGSGALTIDGNTAIIRCDQRRNLDVAEWQRNRDRRPSCFRQRGIGRRYRYSCRIGTCDQSRNRHRREIAGCI